MTRPGVVVTSRADIPPRSAPTDAGMAFMVGATATGTEVARVVSMTEYEAEFGSRTGAADTYDAAETFFREGGSVLTVSPNAVVADGLDALEKALGPGQVFAPGAVGYAAGAHDDLIAHAAANNRIALLDADPAADAAALITLAGGLTANPNARYAALFAPPAVVPGVTPAAPRTVSYAALEAGIMSRNAAQFSPNVAAAGINGISRFATDLATAFVDADREDLNDAGVNVARLLYGQVETYGYRTLAPESSGWLNLGNARLNMEIVAKAEEVGERYVFSQIDGRGIVISAFGAELSGMLTPYYDAGSLFGESAHDAFFVDVGQAVNTPTTIANGELHAVIGLRMSPFAEWVVIEIVKVATDQPLSVIA